MSIDESLSDILDVEPMASHLDEHGQQIVVYSSPTNPPPVPVQSPEQQIEEDTALARQNIKGLLVKGGEALNSLINISTENQHPRSFEVVANMLKTLSEINHDLLDTHKTKRDLIRSQPATPATGNTTIHAEKAIFFGSTAELSARLKAQQESDANGHTDISQ